MSHCWQPSSFRCIVHCLLVASHELPPIALILPWVGTNNPYFCNSHEIVPFCLFSFLLFKIWNFDLYELFDVLVFWSVKLLLFFFGFLAVWIGWKLIIERVILFFQLKTENRLNQTNLRLVRFGVVRLACKKESISWYKISTDWFSLVGFLSKTKPKPIANTPPSQISML